MSEARDLTVPNVLLLNCETSGLYREDLTPFDPAQPWVMSCAAMLCNEAGAVANSFNLIIKADGRTAKDNAVKVHGISPRVTAQIGIPEPRFLGLLADLLKTMPMTSMKVVTFSDFDRKVISGLFSRFGESQGKPNAYDKLWAARPGTEFIDIQKPLCQLACKLPSALEGVSDFKWPSLDEAAEIILGRAPRTGHHDAWKDMLVLRDLYLHFAKRGHFTREAA